MRLSKERAIALHRELWTWLAKNGSAHKENWPGWEWKGGEYPKVAYNCFPCEYDNYHENFCISCPLDWGENRPCYYGLFDKWDYSETRTERKKYARLIRDLPERK